MLDGWKYCPLCAAPIRRESECAVCPACGFVGYATSAPTAAAVIADEHGRVLLARRAVEPEQGKWDLPGGFLHEGEDPIDGLRRELREETSIEIEPLEFLGAWIDHYGTDPGAVATLNLYWLARTDNTHLQPADDVAELVWYSPNQLPELAFHVNALVLEAWQQKAGT